MNDDSILQRLQARDVRALEQLMNRYIPYISSIVWNILCASMAKEDAEEVVSDVFLAAWENAGKIRPGCVKAWLGAVARNKARNKLRALGLTLPLEEDALEIPDEATPDSLAQQAERDAQIRRAVESLGEPDREVFLRHYYYGQTVQQISARMGMKESTVKTKLRRGRMRLKECFVRWDVR